MAEPTTRDDRGPQRPSITEPLLTPSVRRTMQFVLLAILIALLGILVWQINQLRSWERQTLDTEFERTQREVRDAAVEIEDRLQTAMLITRAVAQNLGTGKLERAQTSARLRAVMETSPQLGALGAAFEPLNVRASGPNRRLYAPTIIRRGEDKLVEQDLSTRIDYTKFAERWYRDPMFHGAMWVEPYVHAGTDKVMPTYAVPFLRADASEAPGGVVTVSYPMAAIKLLVNGVAQGRNSYAYLLSREGRFVIHPNNEEVREGNTLFKDAMQREDVALYDMTIRAIKGGAGFIDHTDLDQSAWIFFQPIPAAGWSLIVVSDKDELLDPDRYRRSVIDAIILAAAASLCFIALVGSMMIQGALLSWFLVVGFSALCIAAIAAIWTAAAVYPRPSAVAMDSFEIATVAKPAVRISPESSVIAVAMISCHERRPRLRTTTTRISDRKPAISAPRLALCSSSYASATSPVVRTCIPCAASSCNSAARRRTACMAFSAGCNRP